MERKFLRLNDIAPVYNLKVRQLRTMCQQGKIKALKIGKMWFISQSEIDRLFRVGVPNGR